MERLTIAPCPGQGYQTIDIHLPDGKPHYCLKTACGSASLVLFIDAREEMETTLRGIQASIEVYFKEKDYKDINNADKLAQTQPDELKENDNVSG